MRALGKRLRRRAEDLGLSDAEVARRAGLTPRRYGFYVTGDRQPDYQTLISICEALNTTPNVVLGFDKPERLAGRKRAQLAARLEATTHSLTDAGLELVAKHADLVLGFERK